MLRLHIEGKEQQIQPFLLDLKQHHPDIDLIDKKVKDEKVEITMKCEALNKPKQRVKTVVLHTTDGQSIHIPILDMVMVQLEDKVKFIAGRSFDIFG